MLDSGVSTAANIAFAAGQVEMLIVEVRDIANRTIGKLHDDADTDTRSFENVSLPADAFGKVPAGLTFARQHQAAHEVFTETMRGVIKDLDDFRQALLDCATGHENNDEAVRASLLNVSRTFESRDYQSDKNYDESLGRHDEGLHTGKHRDHESHEHDSDEPGHKPSGPDSTPHPPTVDRTFPTAPAAQPR